MAGSRYLDIVVDAETITTVTNQRAWVNRLANQACAKVAAEYDWPFLWTTDFFPVIAQYATGTVNITVGSATVTGTNTVWVTTWTNRKIRFGSEGAFYTVKSFDSPTSLTLDQLYQGTSNTAQTYYIYQDEYLLRADVDQSKFIRQMANQVTLISKDASELDWDVPSPTSTGPADFSIPIGRAVKTYTTGTLSGSSGSRILTGSGTTWTGVQGLGRGSKVVVGTTLLTVKSVDSDTQLTIYEALASAVASGTAYTVWLDNLAVELYPIPIVADNYFYRFQRIPAVMDASGDIPDFPEQLHPLILLWILPWLYGFRGQTQMQAQAAGIYQAELQKMILRYSQPNPDQVYQRRDADLRPGRGLASFPPNFGVPLDYP